MILSLQCEALVHKGLCNLYRVIHSVLCYRLFIQSNTTCKSLPVFKNIGNCMVLMTGRTCAIKFQECLG